MNLQRFAQEKTEPATPKRRTEARRRGQVPRSAEVASAVLLLGTFVAIKTSGAGMVDELSRFTRETLANPPVRDLDPAAVLGLLPRTLWLMARVTMPVVLTAAGIGLASNIAQVGWQFTPGALRFDFGRLNPAAGLARMFSRLSAFELVKSLAKAGVLGYVVYRTIQGDLGLFPRLADMELGAIASTVGGLALDVLWKAGLALLVIAAVDYYWQRLQFESSLRMTKEEIKEELRETEGDARVRGRIRERQRTSARRRMMEEVKRADVVVTNPTHYAVALRYEAREMAAPRVVAKGRGYLALKIAELARQHGVGVVENPPLARALYASVEIGQLIPPELYQAVAEVLAFVYRTKRLAQRG